MVSKKEQYLKNAVNLVGEAAELAKTGTKLTEESGGLPGLEDKWERVEKQVKALQEIMAKYEETGEINREDFYNQASRYVNASKDWIETFDKVSRSQEQIRKSMDYLNMGRTIEKVCNL